MIKIVKPLLIFVLFFLLEACSTLSGLKFWENDEDEMEAPAELIEISKSVSLDSEWN